MEKSLTHKLLLSAVFVVVCTITALVFAQEQELPVLKDVGVRATVNYDKKEGLYSYTYSMANPASNTGKIFDIEIDISKPENSVDLSSEGLIITLGTDRFGKILTRSYDDELAMNKTLMKKEIVPIGINPPEGWGAGVAVVGTAHWGGNKFESLIMPGQSHNGYKIFSYGIPALRDITIHPHWLLMAGDVSDEDVEMAERIEKEIAFYTKTIGPTAPPLDFKPLEFLDYIISLKHEASSLGWITNKGIEQSLDAKLDNARKKLEQGKNDAAKNILIAFINEVEAQGCESYEGGSAPCPKGKHLTPEAYALLKYNVLYLIGKL